jgi:2-oxoisovalerate dehydrogenase E1 component
MNDIEALPEFRAYQRLKNFLNSKIQGTKEYDWIRPPSIPIGGYTHEMNATQTNITIDAALITFCLHVEARIASMIGAGFYTIGPCGEEALSSVGLCLKPYDSLALHYRHGGVNICRQIVSNQSPRNEIILNRARGYTVSKNDPVTGGVHCSIGSNSGQDYIVTSTLASQCPSAVGRALGYSLLRQHNQDKTYRPISVVTIGDGSVHNHHFWSAFHLARHARHQNKRCPVVFGVSDNNWSISYKTGGYVDTLWLDDPLVLLYKVNGNDFQHVYSQTTAATTYSRSHSAPAVVLFSGLVRRFGHAATDRQLAYLDPVEIERMNNSTILESMIIQAVESLSATTYSEIRDRLDKIMEHTIASFHLAASEDKVSRDDILDRVASPIFSKTIASLSKTHVLTATASHVGKRDVMRKHMNRVIAESMQHNESVVYLGEDVIHGGYYVVTEGLAKQFPGRVVDFPPDETTLLGAAMGFAQLGLLPIVEIPYAKYLDCGADMFHEIAITNWLSAGKSPVGMIIRLQGFDSGIFGGNFHTSNALTIPPGVDVCCYSNGHDYVHGFRNAIKQANAGRIVMFVDCTNLLNLRHLHDKDREWETSYPDSNDNNNFGFDSIRQYGTMGTWAIVTYGNGVVTSLRARRALIDNKILMSEDELDIIDCFYLSDVPDGLRHVICRYEGIVFADICKQGPGSVLASMVCTLRNEGLLPSKWEHIAAPRTYNPLGSMVSFLNMDDIIHTFERMIKKNKLKSQICGLGE